MIKINIYKERFAEREEIELDEKEIREFMVFNRKSYTAKNTFKKFIKYYKIRLCSGESYEIPKSSFELLKQELKGKYKSSHITETVFKNYSERKATDWTYKMIQ